MSMIQLTMSGTANISNIHLRPNMSERSPAGIAPSRAPMADMDPSQAPDVSGAVLAFSLAHWIRRAKTERDFIRWELSESVSRNYSPLHLTDPMGSVPIVKNRELMGSIY
uniref:Uncharacterized protein n=1 Tax=Timema genevievae TaxID=629358 RepID=A0A7R9PRE9_TIMGE|nr:unnamed protein product [Timema genevievae]